MPYWTNCSNRLGLVACAALLALGGCVQGGAVPVHTGPGPTPFRIAVLPLDDLSGSRAPVRDIRRSLIMGLGKQGVAVLDEEQAEAFLAKNRIRYISGIDPATAQAWKEQTGADAVLITSCELYSRGAVPKVFLTSRLVSTRDTAILWTESAGLSGDDSPGILGIGLIDDVTAIADKAVDRLSRSLALRLSGEQQTGSAGKRGPAPEILFRSPSAGLDLQENTLSFLLRSSLLDERSGKAGIPVLLNARTSKTVMVDYAATFRSANGGDSTLRSGRLSFAPGETVKTIELASISRIRRARDKTVEVTLRNPRNAMLGEITLHTAAIADAHPPAVVNLTPAVRRLPKQIGNVTFPLELTAISAQDVAVPFTVSGTATESAGYRLMTPSPVVIKAGERSAGITVAVGDDRLHGPDRTLGVALLAPENALIGSQHALRLTIEDRSGKPSVVVLPFFNDSSQKNAGEVLMLQFIKELRNQNIFEVIEPGIVRQHLLNTRTVMDKGVSIADAGPIFDELNADLILSGRIMDYEDYEQSAAPPKVDFSVEVIERRSRKIVWSAKSRHRGDEDVLMFDWGRVNSAIVLAANMVRAVVDTMAAD